jgi:hypothetical protein
MAQAGMAISMGMVHIAESVKQAAESRAQAFEQAAESLGQTIINAGDSCARLTRYAADTHRRTVREAVVTIAIMALLHRAASLAGPHVYDFLRRGKYNLSRLLAGL